MELLSRHTACGHRYGVPIHRLPHCVLSTEDDMLSSRTRLLSNATLWRFDDPGIHVYHPPHHTLHLSFVLVLSPDSFFPATQTSLNPSLRPGAQKIHLEK